MLQALPQGASCTVLALNNVGQAVGQCDDGIDRARAIMWDTNSGVAVDISPANGWAEVVDLNDAGQVAASICVTNGNCHAARFDGGQWTIVGKSGDSAPYSINRSGDMVGIVDSDEHPDARAVRWVGGVETILPSTPGQSSYGTATLASSINDSGEIVGYKQSATRALGFDLTEALSWSATPTVEPLPGRQCVAVAINADGTIVGQSVNHRNLSQVVVWKAGEMSDLPGLPGSTYDLPYRINASGQIVGGSNSNTRAVTWIDGAVLDLNTVVPADSVPPSTTLMLARAVNDAGWIGTQFEQASTYFAYPVILKPIGN